MVTSPTVTVSPQAHPAHGDPIHVGDLHVPTEVVADEQVNVHTVHSDGDTTQTVRHIALARYR